MKNRFFSAARFLRAAALFTALILLFSSCSLLRPDGEQTDAETPTESSAPEETAVNTEPETEKSEPEAPSADRTGEEIYRAHPELTPVNYDSPALLPRTEDAGVGYIDNVTFLCDSPFYWLKLFGLLSGGYDTTQVWTGPEGTMTLGFLNGFELLDPYDGALRTIPDTVALHRPPVMIITVGINGVALWYEAEFRDAYVSLIDWIRTASPDTEIVLQSILPIAPSYAHWGEITNASITEANAWILEIAEECGLHYLDTFSVLVGEDGNIRSDLVQDDGLHENEEGLKLALEYIRTHALTVNTAEAPADRTGEEIYQTNGELTPVNYNSPALLPLTADAGQGYIDNITFLCDSPFYALKVFEMLSGGYGTTQIWTGPEGTMTLGYLDGFEILDPYDGALRTIPDALALHKPPVLMITLGINGVALWGEAEFRAAYVRLIDTVRAASPDTVILTQSILPISPAYENWGMFTNALITEANSWILEISEQYGLHYLDTYSALAGEDGNIRPEFVQIDGLHIRPEGLEAALSYIRTHAYLP